MIPYLQRFQGFAVDDYSFTLGRLGSGVSLTFAQLGHNLKRAKGNPMKAYRKELWFDVPTRRALIDITPQVNARLKESGIREGLVLVKAKHTLFITQSHLFYGGILTSRRKKYEKLSQGAMV